MKIDWAATGTWMQAWAGFAQAIAVLIAAYVAANTFNSWRKQRLEERRIDAAERVISLAYKAKQAFIVIRSPITSEAARDEATYNLIQGGLDLSTYTADRQKRIIEAQIVLDRINRYSELWNSFTTTMPVASAYFGEEVEQCLEEFWRQKTAVQVAAEQYPLDDGSDPTFSQEITSTIWENRHQLNIEDDRIALTVADTIARLEKLLLPIIRFERPINLVG